MKSLPFYQNKKFYNPVSSLIGILVVIYVSLINPSFAYAQIDTAIAEDGTEYLRSLESLRDLDFQTWQLVVYNQGRPKGSIVLRIVGYPGKLRIDHPLALNVQAGRKEWNLKDITLENSKLVNDPREAAAEFEIAPLLFDLTNNKPLRLYLSGVFKELPIPPYVVREWLSILNTSQIAS